MILVVCVLLSLTYLAANKLVRLLKIGNYEDKHVFITGCDSGFGRELANRLDSLGFNVFAGCMTIEGAKSLSESCSKRLNTIILDITRPESIDKALAFVETKLPEGTGTRIWTLVNNAGILGNLSMFELCTKQDFSKVLDVNVLGPFQLTQKFLPLLRKSKGRIVNITSMCGRFPLFGVPYCVSKFALEAMSDMLRRDMYLQGIHVAILEPGGFNTSMVNADIVKKELKLSLERASKEVQDVYTIQFAQWEATMEKVALISKDLSPVINAYTHAVTSKYPHTRYVVGMDAKYLFIPLSYLPSDISDAFLRLGFRFILGLFR